MSTKKIKPLGNRIVVKRHEAKTSKGGILLPEAAQEKPRQGEVIAVGPGKMDDKGRQHPVAASNSFFFLCRYGLQDRWR